MILCNNAGVARASDAAPGTRETMGAYAADCVGALGLSQVDVRGCSMDGSVAQGCTLRYPQRVRRLLVVGTGPRAAEPTQAATVMEPTMPPETSLADVLSVFFAPSARSQAAGRAFWERHYRRQHEVDPPTSPQTRASQIAAFTAWRHGRGARWAQRTTMAQPTLVVNGSQDVRMPTITALTLSQHIPTALRIVSLDTGHALPLQYPDLFLCHARRLLNG